MWETTCPTEAWVTIRDPDSPAIKRVPTVFLESERASERHLGRRRQTGCQTVSVCRPGETFGPLFSIGQTLPRMLEPDRPHVPGLEGAT